MGRVEQAKQVRSIYWNVTSKDDTSKDDTSKDDTSKDDNDRTRARPARKSMTNRAIRIPDSPIQEPLLQAVTILEAPARERDITPESQAPSEDMEARASVGQSAVEDWATPATQQGPEQQQSTINPQISVTQQSVSHGQAGDGILVEEITESSPANTEPPRAISYPLDDIAEEFNIHDADAWLADLEGIDTSDWLHGTVETARSPPTSLEIYSNWPYLNAELTIAQCMKICVYCGKDFQSAAELRKHMKKSEYARRNLRIQHETRGRGSSNTPAWTSIRSTGTPIQRSDSEPVIPRPTACMTRSQSVINSANGAERLW
ncbi:hypothetical protein BJ875DRAFT_523146 [Amylocarpus encephaloides]|uniref:C2H2-type domain-containing protein n=1 Tax=Amylocarpus encephaloides TaxID=45428 RepID=A0A9P7YAL6_9HELO|nr:hypothetical protein BJ875DRAFT_523146 [Amylocarpus encephaloides]